MPQITNTAPSDKTPLSRRDHFTKLFIVIMTWLVFIAGLIVAANLALTPAHSELRVWMNMLQSGAALVALIMIRRQQHQFAAQIIVWTLFVLSSVSLYVNGGLFATNLSNIILQIMTAGWLLSTRQTMLQAFLLCILAVFLENAASNGWLPPPSSTQGNQLVYVLIVIAVSTTLVLLSKRSYLIRLTEVDVSNAKLSAQALELRESEQRFRCLVEQSMTGVYMIRNDKVIYINPRAVDILGYSSADEILGRSPLEFLDPMSQSESSERMRRMLSGEMMQSRSTYIAKRKDGSKKEIGIASSLGYLDSHPVIIGMLQDISDKEVAEAHIRRYAEQLEHTFIQTVIMITALNEMRDPYTAGHEQRVSAIAVEIGKELGLDEDRLEGLRIGGLLHDVGKISIPAELLSKPTKLTKIEYEMIQGHAQAGYDVLKSVDFPWPVAQIALQHHERMDGSGYPNNLKGDEILLEARILAVADTVEAMASHRPYRPGLGIDAALNEISRGHSTIYDAHVVDACLTLFNEHGYVLKK